MNPRLGRKVWLPALLSLVVMLVMVPATESLACHKYISPKTGAKGCAARRADRKSANSANTAASANSQGSPTSSGPSTSARTSPPPRAGDSDRNRLQWNGKWIGGSPSAATQFFTLPIGVPYGKSSSGKAAAALRVKIRKSGTLVGVSVVVRMNKPWTAEGKNKYKSYSIGDGGRAIIEIRNIKNRDSSDPEDWVPDMSASGLLAVTEVNGQKAIQAVADKYLEPRIKNGKARTIPMWEWKLTKPLRVSAGQKVALVVRHIGDNNVNTRFTINSNGLYGSPAWKARPFGKNGPIYGDIETVMYSTDRRKWSTRLRSRSRHPIYALIYSDGDVRGSPFEVGNSACRDRIGGSKWARMKIEIPNRYPGLTLDEVWVAAFRNKNNVGNMTIELRDASMRILNSTSIPASSFSMGIPRKGDRLGSRYWSSHGFPSTRVTPGTYYVVLRSSTVDAYWLQGFSEDATYIARNMASKVKARFIDALDMGNKSYRIEKSIDGGRSWEKWKGYCEVFPILFRTR